MQNGHMYKYGKAFTGTPDASKALARAFPSTTESCQWSFPF